ncbi:hypothetical protein BJ875DRAFT_396337 [Amylocarpus encephaloides]|uniref:RING-type domain-containing protein n=1 Tax=Amylocarpus encephaloides TaxID=45428 RepID=A0A9P7YNG9_9HELO|nr:hypothetical protein BJ875DRAFT_396337 [Amylocarpus encephaloides]
MSAPTKTGLPPTSDQRWPSVLASGVSSRGTTPVGNGQTKPTTKNKVELAGMFDTDLTKIRNLVTCPICDQLLYEPWTLACGHTYCYSCLCNWFVPNKRKKTCPECRTKVKQIPAPSFLVKQLVEVFVKRSELIPSDETIEQHTERRSEQVAEVEKDRSSPLGLFKGVFTARVGELYRDDYDNVIRCRECGHEHEGGPDCEHCGAILNTDDLSGIDDEEADLDELDALSLELEDGLEAEFEEHDSLDVGHPRNFERGFLHPLYTGGHHHPRPGPSRSLEEEFDEMLESDGSDEAGSLDDFVAADDEDPIRPPGQHQNRRRQRVPVIEISDDESDEGGDVSDRIPRRRSQALASSSPEENSSMTSGTDNETDADVDDTNSEAEMLRRSGWSPLDTGNDSDAEDQFRFRRGFEYNEDDEELSDDNSDTETIGGNSPSDDEEDRSRDGVSQTPTYDGGYDGYNSHRETPDCHGYSGTSVDIDNDSVSGSSAYDRDGDTEMSVSPRASRSVSIIQGEDDIDLLSDIADGSRSERSMSRDTNGNSQHDMQDLGVANRFYDLDDESDDGPVAPQPHRFQRRYHPNARTQHFDPRISMIFAKHQQSMRSGQEPGGLEELDSEVRCVEPGPRSRRITAYRQQPARRTDSLRISRSPSATRIIASSSRASRPPAPRHYAMFNRGPIS